MKRSLAVVAAIGILAIGGCAVQPQAPQKTSLEIQSIQSKSFETDKKVAFNSVVSVLQDLGYIIGSASLDTGFITAEGAVQNQTGFWDAMGGVRREHKTAVTASVEEMKENSTRVRLNFVLRQKRSAQYGQQANDDQPIQDAKIYQNAFDKIDEAIFIRKGNKS